MRTMNGIHMDLVVQVRAETRVGEIVFISGNTPELGEWKVSQAVPLKRVTVDGNIWQGMICVPSSSSVQYRYLICTNVENDDLKQENIVRQWESHLRPRTLLGLNYVEDKVPMDIFGHQGEEESIASGWLTSETIVQLKMFNNSVTIWKRKLREKSLSIRLSTIDITRRDSEAIGITDDDSTLTEPISRSWPIVEVAQMNDANWQFTQQSQFGITYNPTDYVIFQIQMLKLNTIANPAKGRGPLAYLPH